MLFIASAQGTRVSKCLLNANLPAKRLASLTGAIERGTRKARDARERHTRYNSRLNPSTDNDFGRRQTKDTGRAASSEGHYGDRKWAQAGKPPQGKDDANEQNRASRYPQREPRQVARDPRSTNRPTWAGRERVSFVKQPREVAQDPRSMNRPSWAGRDGANEQKRVSRYSQREPLEVAQHPRSSNRPSWAGRERETFAGEPSAHRRSSYSQAKPRDRLQYYSEAADIDAQDRRRAEPIVREEASRWPASKGNPGSGRSLRPEDRHQRRANTVDQSLAEKYPKRHVPKSATWQRSQAEDEDNMTEQDDRQQIPPRKHVTVPLSIPRSSAASEFIYGASAVKAALQAGNRKLYKLYTCQGVNGMDARESDREFLHLAETRGLPIKRLENDSRLLDKMAQGRPHNGFVLEASQLPNTLAETLDSVDRRGDDFSFTAGYQSAEDIAVNGNSSKILSSKRRYPFVLMLDSILDPGNLGAIIRSAAFFGVDAIALIEHNLAPFSPVTLKASAGAAEGMRYLKIKKDLDFVNRSQANGWKFFAAVAPTSASASRGRLRTLRSREVEEALREAPCVLMLGGEGDGLRPRLQKAADGMVAIDGAAGLSSESGLDSLNVSVAAALLMQTFVKGSNTGADPEVVETGSEPSRRTGKLF
jgi:21S rRNA (GM2251-2'-O)-methyltransferase